VKKNLGGKRPGAGRPKGSGGAEAQAKALSRQYLAKTVKRYLRPLVHAHLAKAMGTCKLMLRQMDGTWRTVTTEDDIEKALNGDPNLYWIAPNQPDSQSFNTLLAYGLDKPKEQPQEVQHSIGEDLIERLAKGRQYARERLSEGAIDAELVKPVETRETIPSAQRAVPESGAD